MLTHANLAWKNANCDPRVRVHDRDVVALAAAALPRRRLNVTLPFLVARHDDVIMPTTGFDAAAVVDGMERARRDDVLLRPDAVGRDHGAPGSTTATCALRRDVGRREDADPAARAHPAHVPVGVVRRRLRADRDVAARRRSSRPRTHVTQDGLRRPAVRCTSSCAWSTTTTTCAPGEVGEIVYRGPNVMRGLLARPRRDRRGVRRRLVPHRRPRAPRRRRLPLHRRPHEGHDRLRRREHLPAPRSSACCASTRRSPRSPSSASRTRAGARRRWRSSCAPARADRGRAHRALPHAAGRLQEADGGRVRRRLPRNATGKVLRRELREHYG